ncbi:hypothetical protein N7520_003523 [Penicillium odoratum]|uniref:uncharacterized protein n=1 Tax=Penicillium odoratum TaxID=1167516 RepID=UPI002548B80A|nr:uncharacterized protein N7520_003523 [Penicillium odoratum]KAJ5768964.1 hypothetical protein N7520_003523 [Penicillium odoratum]
MSDSEAACYLRDKAARYLVGDRLIDRIRDQQEKEKIPNEPNDGDSLGPILGPIPDPIYLRPEHGPLNLPKAPLSFRPHKPEDEESLTASTFKQPHIGIIGAGVAGLFTAMLIDQVNGLSPTGDLLTYEILESSARTGGRVYTKHFDTEIWNDYYDIGAMRFPDIPIMDRTFRLFKALGFEKGVDLLDYYLEGENCPQRFNDITYVAPKEGSGEHDPFHFSIANKGLVPNSTINDGAGEILADAFDYYKYELKKDFEKGFKKLMRRDHLTTREYLRQVITWKQQTGLSHRVSRIAQLLIPCCSATALYDQAFTESVMDSFDFDYPIKSDTSKESPESDTSVDPPEPKVQWFCIKGGTSKVIERMETSLKTKVSHNHRVTSIQYNQVTTNEKISDQPMEIKVMNEFNESETKSFSAVFSTATLACTQRMDLREAGLSRSQLDAMRNLHYDASTKVAIEFDNPWWITKCGIVKGGSASTDLPIRTCVYPSYNLDAKGKAVLLCSYTWAQDAQRMGSLVNNEAPEGKLSGKDSQLKELLIHNLALLHKESASYEEMRSIIAEAYIQHHGFDWYADPHTSGAFALFGPGQFANYYPDLIDPAANGHLYLAGEACSTHHAWIVGALDSAYRALVLYLRTLGTSVDIKEILLALEGKWGELRQISSDALDWQAYLSKCDLTKGDS